MASNEITAQVYRDMYAREFDEVPTEQDVDVFCKMVGEYDKEISRPTSIHLWPVPKALFVLRICEDAFAVLHKDRVFTEGMSGTFIRERYAQA